MILKGGQVGGEGLFDKLAGLSVNTKQPSPDRFRAADEVLMNRPYKIVAIPGDGM